jgi:hypothetical protein
MAILSTFACELLEEAKHFLEKSREARDPNAKTAYLHAALLVGFAAFEAHVNAVADDFLVRGDLNPHERGILAEHPVELIDGAFEERATLKMHRLEDRVLFLCRRFSRKKIDRQTPQWCQFVEALRLRNSLTHPKPDPPVVEEDAIRNALGSIIELLNLIFKNIYKKNLPAHNRGLTSRLNF